MIDVERSVLRVIDDERENCYALRRLDQVLGFMYSFNTSLFDYLLSITDRDGELVLKWKKEPYTIYKSIAAAAWTSKIGCGDKSKVVHHEF